MSTTFASALEESLSEALRSKADVISVVVVDGNRRTLLTSASLSYVITLLSSLDRGDPVKALQAAMTDEAFLNALRQRSGLPIISVSPLIVTAIIVNPSPSMTPTSVPDPVPAVEIESNRSAGGVGTVHA